MSTIAPTRPKLTVVAPGQARRRLAPENRSATLLKSLPVDTDLTCHDMFCGAGGASSGLKKAGFRTVSALNHWKVAIATHNSNFPDAQHIEQDTSNYDMRRLRRARCLWASPICTEMSPAGGNKADPTREELHQLALLQEDNNEEGPVDSKAFERTRATFWDVLRATEIHQYDAVMVENVVDVAWKWRLFDSWIYCMKKLNYRVQFVSVSSAHLGDETNVHAPQWRDRLYMVFTRLDIKKPDLAPRPLAFCRTCDKVVNAKQSWKNTKARKDNRPIGKYGQQYIYRCPNHKCQQAPVEPYVLPAVAAIDWTNLGTPVGDRKRPLVDATRRRIKTGIELFSVVSPEQAEQSKYPTYPVPPFTVPSGGTWRTAPEPITQSPMPARTASESDGLVCPPFLANVNHGEGDSGRHSLPTDGPLPTRSTKIGEGVVCPPFVPMLRNHATATGVDEPLATMAASGNHHGLAVPSATVPDGAFIQKHHGGVDYAGVEHMVKSVHEPLPAVVAKVNNSLVIPFRRGAAPYRATSAPLSTMTTRQQHGLLVTDDEIDACLFRMLTWGEHLAAQRFDPDYIVTGSGTERTMQAGNAVSCNAAEWIGRRVRAVLT